MVPASSSFKYSISGGTATLTSVTPTSVTTSGSVVLLGLKPFLTTPRGDEILTSGGIIGKVTKADAERLNVDIAKDVNVTIYRSTVADVLNKK